ncbi:MAG TPA: esterase-like activity of phytase family protein [Hansschlegelia sp.]
MIRVLSALLIAASFSVASAAVADDAAAVDVSVKPIERFDSRTPIGGAYGHLIFLGGLQISSSDPDFGGLSGLRLGGDGRSFTAISDRGNWFHGALAYEGTRLAGVSEVTRSPTPGRDGKPLAGRRGLDTEALEIQGRTAWVSSERVTWLTRYALRPDGLPQGRGVAVRLPGIAIKAPRNEGYEAIAALPSGGVVLVGEKFLDDNGDNRAFVVGIAAPYAFAVRRTDDFSPTDLTQLPGGGFALLERRWRPPFSLTVRIRRLAGSDIKPGAIIDGPVLMEATLAQAIDNFEGISAHRSAGGRTVLTLVSDDNFSIFQRTLLMQFALPD